MALLLVKHVEDQYLAETAAKHQLMISFEQFRKLALALPQTTEDPHFEKSAFRVHKKIFATYDAKHERACLKLSEIDQDIFLRMDAEVIYPVDNKWGKQGWTLVEMKKVKSKIFCEALTKAYIQVAPTKLSAEIKLNNRNS